LAQLVDYAKSHPGELTCGSAGNGTSSHLACELLNQMAGLKVMHIPYKGGGAAMTDLMGGRISFLIDVMPNVSGQIAAGKLRALAVTTPERVASNPDIPTMSEAGVKGYEFFAWDGLYAPKGTPVAVLDKLNAAVNKALQQPEVKKALESRGAIPSPTSRQSLAEFGAEDTPGLGKVVKPRAPPSTDRFRAPSPRAPAARLPALRLCVRCSGPSGSRCGRAPAA